MSDYKVGLPDLTNASLLDIKLRSQTQSLEQLKLRSGDLANVKDSKKSVTDAAQQFEGLLIQQMLKSMWETVPKDGLLTGSREEEHYRDMLNQAYAEELSKGQGLGIKGLIAGELEAKKSDPTS